MGLVDITWQRNVGLQRLVKSMFIALPGNNYETIFTLNHGITDKNSKLHVAWQNHRFKVKLIQETAKPNYIKYTLLSLDNIETTYFVLGNISEYFHHRVWENKEKRKISWKDADQKCRKINAHLPYFTSAADLDEFIAMVKSSFKFPIIEAIFIGLTFKENKVYKLNYL